MILHYCRGVHAERFLHVNEYCRYLPCQTTSSKIIEQDGTMKNVSRLESQAGFINLGMHDMMLYSVAKLVE